MSESPMPPNEQAIHEREVARLAAFTDGVMIVAMTLLVLDIRLPQHAVGLDDRALIDLLKQVIPNYLGYAISFLVIGLFWMGNVRRFRRLVRIDTGLIWLTLLYLLTIGVMPFVTSVLSDNPGRVGTQLYAGVVVIASLFSAMIGWHARRKHLIDPAAPPNELARTQLRSRMNLVVFAVSIPVAQFNPDLAKLFWMALIPASAIMERIWARRDKRVGRSG